MKSAARLCLSATLALPLAACVYYPPPPATTSHPFERHPGVAMEVTRHYDYNGVLSTTTSVVNHSNMAKCAWTQGLPSRLLRPGESWQVAQGQSPGTIGISNVTPEDPNCMNAKRDHG